MKHTQQVLEKKKGITVDRTIQMVVLGLNLTFVKTRPCEYESAKKQDENIADMDDRQEFYSIWATYTLYMTHE